MANNLRFGVVGLGMGMNRAGVIHGTDGAELVAVADLKAERRKAAEEKFGCESHENALEMFDRDDIDVAMIMTPSGLHGHFGEEAARRGKHVITTKPMDVSVENCNSLIKTCEDNNVKLLVDFSERYGGTNRRIKAALDQGAIGKPLLCELRMKWKRPDSYYVGWHGTWELDGGGSIMNQGVHSIDLMLWLMGPVKRVIGAHYDVYDHENCETEDMTSAILEFENGALGHVLTTTTYPGGSITMVHIHGQTGIVGVGPDVWQFPEGEEPEIELPPYPGNVIQDAIRVVNEDAAPAVDGYEGRRSVELNMAIYECARSGKAVTL